MQPTDHISSQVLIESSALEQVLVIHSGLASKRAGLVSTFQAIGGILPGSHVSLRVDEKDNFCRSKANSVQL
ncbi:hypothetical protein TNCV_3503161 [Trichonephila clavipes]|uniref:Uncharacterized protein n=1 Tax=Trichonephila clavipes TaxID=2585209 RepID=A0A8X6VDT1_TRICX|nr:hypothetical protein TNCV_3503161 [Trichonephila clavipes]